MRGFIAQVIMHELGIMTEAIRMAVEAAGSRRVRKMTLRVGVLSGVAPDALRFAFEVAAHGTVVAGAVLEIETVAAVCWCANCHQEFESGNLLDACPRCNDLSGDLRRGRGLEIAAVELI